MERRDQPEAKTEAEVVDAFRKGTNFHHLPFVKKQNSTACRRFIMKLTLPVLTLINSDVFPSYK